MKLKTSVHAGLREMRRQASQQISAVGGGEQLLVAHRHRLTDQLAQLLGEQLALVRVEALVVGRRAPPLRMPRGDLHRKQAAEDRVARERRRGRENAVVVRLLDVEHRGDQIAQHFPLIEPQAVDHDEYHAAGAFERRHEKLRAHIDRQRRAVFLRIREPARIVSGDEALKILAETLLQRAQRLGQSGFVARGEPHFPARQLGDELGPFAPRQVRAAAPLELAKPRDEVARQALLANPVAFEQARHDRQHLARMHRLHEVIVDFDPDRVAQQGVVFALRHHDDGHGRIDRANFWDQLDAAAPGHLLVQQDNAVRLAPQHRERVIAVRRLRDRESLLLEELAMRREPVDFVVDPEDTLRTRHLA